MRRRSSNQQVAEAWVRGEFAMNGKRNFMATGGVASSYGVLIGYIHDGKATLYWLESGQTLTTAHGQTYDASFSPTTQRHRQALTQALLAAGYRLGEITDCTASYNAPAKEGS